MMGLASGTLLMIVVVATSLIPMSFADHVDVTVDIPKGTSTPGCETTGRCFLPSSVTVDVGGTVTWINSDTVAHTVSSGSIQEGLDGLFDSGFIPPGGSFSVTFDVKPGTYPYFSIHHPWSAGIVTVSGSDASGASSAYAKNLRVYVEPLPDWADYASNVMYLSTEAWEEAKPGLKFYQADDRSDADFAVKWVKEFGTERLGYAYGSQFVEVGLGDSRCAGQWNPFSERYISHIMKHEIGHIFGHGHNDDPDSIMYPIALNMEYGLVEESYRLAEGYGQFVEFCTIKDLTSYEFSITTTDETYGFDYYVIPSFGEFEKWADNEPFQYYSGQDCSGEGWLSFSGTCRGVSSGSGILVIMDSELTTPLETITLTRTEAPGIAHSRVPLSMQSPDSGGFEFEEPAMTDTPRKFATGANIVGNTASMKGADDLVTFEITGGVLQSVRPEVENQAIIVGVTATDNGLLRITIPRTVADALYDDGQDDRYFVLVDGKEVNFEETATSTDRTLAIRFPTGAEEILIIGTWVVPEFGAIAVMILAVAIVSVIAVSARSRLDIFLRY